MKSIFFLVLLSAISTMACPDLTGTYICGYDQSTGEPNTLRVQQTDPITFRILLFGQNEDLTYTADGRLLTLDDETSLRTFLTVCAPGANALQFTANIVHKTENWKQRIATTYLKTAANKMDFSLEQDLSKKDQDMRFSTTYHCTKN